VVGRHDFDPADIDDVILGCLDNIGSQAGDIARTAALAAGLPEWFRVSRSRSGRHPTPPWRQHPARIRSAPARNARRTCAGFGSGD